MDRSVHKMTISLPPEVAERLDSVAGRLQASRSATLTALLEVYLPRLHRASERLPEPPARCPRRFKGESAPLLRKAVRDLIAGRQVDLFDK